MIKTKRLNIYPASDEQMQYKIAEENIPELKAAYQEMLDGCVAHPDERKWYAIWIIELNDGTGTMIGNLSFKGINEEGIVEIGYGTNFGYEGQGYMTEAVSAVVQWAKKQPRVTGLRRKPKTTTWAQGEFWKKPDLFQPASTVKKVRGLYMMRDTCL